MLQFFKFPNFKTKKLQDHLPNSHVAYSVSILASATMHWPMNNDHVLQAGETISQKFWLKTIALSEQNRKAPKQCWYCQESLAP